MSQEDLANLIIGRYLCKLVELNVVSRDELAGRWYSRCDCDERLRHLGFAAGTSIDSEGIPYIAFDSRLTAQGLVYVLAHESVHLAQICAGIYEPGYGFTVWKGREYENLSADDPNYFSPDHQPWEAEVERYESALIECILVDFPDLRDSSR